MQRWLAIGMALLLLCGGIYVWNRGSSPRGSGFAAVPAAAAIRAGDVAETLVAPVSDVTPDDREARRFGRYDKDKDGGVTRDEYLLSRQKAYARLDLDGNGSLSFNEYAAKATRKFTGADLDRDQILAASEFAATAIKRRERAACPPVAPDDDERTG